MKIAITLCFTLFLLRLQAQEISIIESIYLSKNIKVISYFQKNKASELPVVYFTDGEKMLQNGIIKGLKKDILLPKAHYIFVSTINPENGNDDRNEFFFCNEAYLKFFEEELIPTIESSLDYKVTPEDRSLVGISFGGLNAAYFSANSSFFKNYGLLSPITYPCKTVKEEVVFSKNKDLNIYISSGKNDAENYVRPLVKIYHSKDYNLKTVYTEGAHDFENWNAQIEDLIPFLIGI